MRYSLPKEPEPPGSPWLKLGGLVFKIDNRDVLERDINMFQEKGECAPGDGSIPDDQDVIPKLQRCLRNSLLLFSHRAFNFFILNLSQGRVCRDQGVTIPG
jgi:hypothetical protein